jgi:hypothetical protein
MARQSDRRTADSATLLASLQLTSTTPVHMPLEREAMHPSGIPALAAHVLEVEMDDPHVLSDVLNMDAVTRPEIRTATRARAGTDTAGPSTEDVMRATYCEVLVSKVYAKNGLVDGSGLVAVVDHATYDQRRRDLGIWFPF